MLPLCKRIKTITPYVWETPCIVYFMIFHYDTKITFPDQYLRYRKPIHLLNVLFEELEIFKIRDHCHFLYMPQCTSQSTQITVKCSVLTKSSQDSNLTDLNYFTYFSKDWSLKPIKEHYRRPGSVPFLPAFQF